MTPKITDGELNVLNILWDEGSLPAADVAHRLGARIGWNRNTTYTFINRLVAKGVISRGEPGFLCAANYTRDEVARASAAGVVNKMFGGSLKTLVASFLGGGVSENEIDEVRKLLDDWNEQEGKGGGPRA